MSWQRAAGSPTRECTAMMRDASTAGDARRSFLAALEGGDGVAATRAARTLLGKTPQGAVATFIRRAIENTPANRLPLAPLKVALLSSFSIEFIHDHLIALGFLEGLRIQIYQAGFAQFRQELLGADSGLYAFSPYAVVLALEGKDLVPALYSYDAPDGEAPLETAAAESSQELARLVQGFRERSAATLLVHNFAPPPWRRLGILDGHVGPGQAERVSTLNAALARVCRETRGAYAVDYAGLVQRAGALQWYDDRMDHYAKAPIAQAVLPQLAHEYVKFFRALAGK